MISSLLPGFPMGPLTGAEIDQLLILVIHSAAYRHAFPLFLCLRTPLHFGDASRLAKSDADQLGAELHLRSSMATSSRLQQGRTILHILHCIAWPVCTTDSARSKADIV